MTTNGRPGRKRPSVTIRLPENRAGFTPVEVGDLLAISRTQVYELLKSGELVSFHIGRMCRITADSVAEYIKRRVSAEQDDPARNAHHVRMAEKSVKARQAKRAGAMAAQVESPRQRRQAS